MTESYRPSHETQEEAEPSLPADPTEAAAWLKEVWKGNGGWESQDPLHLKASYSNGYQGMSESEKNKFHKLNNEFEWLAEMYRSEMGWSQSYARTNYGEVIGFRFGYETPKNPENNTPQTYIFRPLDEGQPEIFISKGKDGWQIKPLEEVAAKYAEDFAY